MLRKQNEFESDLDRTEATIADLSRRLGDIDQQIPQHSRPPDHAGARRRQHRNAARAEERTS
jgi:hypothetical protein